jgi:hypothetical protein
LWLFFFFTFNYVFAQIVIQRNINIEDGLVYSQALSTFQDDKGYLWIGTSNGLSRWDGKQFKNYFSTNSISFDNNSDLAVAMRVDPDSHHVSIYLNDGLGVFNSTPDFIYYVGDFPQGIASGDFNNDNITDLVTVNYNDSALSLLYGYGDGTFSNADSLYF